MRRLLFVLRLWILALPLFLIGFGAGLNQAVLAANNNKFPVMLNERKTSESLKPDSWGIIDDDDHEVMSAKTHLNFLADWIDLHTAIYSPGDLLIELGEWLFDFAPIVWLTLVFTDLWRRAEAK